MVSFSLGASAVLFAAGSLVSLLAASIVHQWVARVKFFSGEALLFWNVVSEKSSMIVVRQAHQGGSFIILEDLADHCFLYWCT